MGGMDDVGQMSAGRERNRVLSVSRSKAMKRPAAAQRPPPSVYNTPPQDFRSLVQRLTGAVPMEQPRNPSPASARATNMRLQRIAPLPLQPISAHAHAPPPSPRVSYSPKFGAAQASEGAFPFSQRHNLAPVLSPLKFSPLAPLTPGDSIWASIESPMTANLRFLAGQAGAENEYGGYRWDGMVARSSSPHSLISPLFQASALLPNQGIFAGIDANYNPFSADFPLDFTLPGPDFASGFT